MEPYKERFVREYTELADRLAKLEAMLDKWEAGMLDFTPTCPRYLLEHQRDAMREYRTVLEARAALERVDIAAD